jgi:hypothetical protein
MLSFSHPARDLVTGGSLMDKQKQKPKEKPFDSAAPSIDAPASGQGKPERAYPLAAVGWRLLFLPDRLEDLQAFRCDVKPKLVNTIR